MYLPKIFTTFTVLTALMALGASAHPALAHEDGEAVAATATPAETPTPAGWESLLVSLLLFRKQPHLNRVLKKLKVPKLSELYV